MKTKITIILIIILSSFQMNGQIKNSQLNGTFVFGLNQHDIDHPKNTRAFDTRALIVSRMKQKMTFYGNGSGKGFFYKIENDVLYFKEFKEGSFQAFAKIKRPGNKNDYFELIVQGTTFSIGFYKRSLKK